MARSTNIFLKGSTQRTAAFRAANLDRVRLDRAVRGDLILFRDPSHPAYPHNKPELGVFYARTDITGKTRKSVLTILPINPIKESAVIEPKPYRIVLRNPSQILQSGLNSNMFYSIGHYLDEPGAEHAGNIDRKNKVRFIPINEDALDLDDHGRVHKLGHLTEDVVQFIERRMSDLLSQTQKAGIYRAQIGLVALGLQAPSSPKLKKP